MSFFARKKPAPAPVGAQATDLLAHVHDALAGKPVHLVGPVLANTFALYLLLFPEEERGDIRAEWNETVDRFLTIKRGDPS